MSTDRQDQLIAEYVRNRARVEVPPDLLVPVRAGIADTPQAPRSWFAAVAPAGVVVLALAVVIGLVAIVGLRPGPVGPSASGSAGPSVSLGQKPSLRAFLREVNDRPESLTFYLGLLDGTALYQETLSGSQLSEQGWFGPFGDAFLRLGIEGERWTVDVLTTAGPTPRRIHADDARITALTLSPDGAWLYLARADAASGDDLGIWRLPVAGGDLAQVLEADGQRPTPPRPSASVFFWTPDGSQLLVQHCRGASVPGDDCTWTRIGAGTDEVLGEVTPSAPAGLIVGLANDRLLAGANCDGISCTASLVDFATGAVTDVDVPGARETLIESSAGPILLTDERSNADGYTVTTTELDSGRTWTAYQTDAPIFDLVTLEGGARAVQLDPGWFAVAMEGQLGALHASPPVLVNALDGTQFVMPDIVPDASPAPTTSATPGPLPSSDSFAGTWLPTAEPPIGGRKGHRMVWTGSEVVVWGGIESSEEVPESDLSMPAYGAAYHPVTGTWRRTAEAPIDGRYRPVVAWTGNRMLVWGGEIAISGGYADDGAAYDPATDQWRSLPEAPVKASEPVGGWVAGRFVVVTDTHAAAYIPGTDSWQSLPSAPIRPGWRSAVVIGDRLVVVAFGDGSTGRPEGAILEGDNWKIIPMPLDPLDAGVEFVAGGDLVLVPSVGWALDPSTRSWHPIVRCPGAANGGAWTGTYLIGVTSAYDPSRDGCLELPPSPPRSMPFDVVNGREFAVGVWAGTEYITWSGGTYLDTVWTPNDGAVFSPAN